MTLRHIPKEWLAIATLLVTGAVAWNTLRHDVDDSVRVPRFKEDSINVHYRLDADARRLDALERDQREWNLAICRALPRCTPPQ